MKYVQQSKTLSENLKSNHKVDIVYNYLERILSDKQALLLD